MKKTINKAYTEQILQYKIATYIAGILLIFACSQIYIPLEPIPITMQTVGIMLLALLYNQRDGIITYLSYLSLGMIGIPVFSGYNSGINILFGSSCGYFIGFLVAIYTMNKIKNKIGSDSFIKLAVNCLIGTIIIYFFGIAWLSISIGIKTALMVGLVPFIIPGIFKSIILSAILNLLRIIK